MKMTVSTEKSAQMSQMDSITFSLRLKSERCICLIPDRPVVIGIVFMIKNR